MTYKTVTDNWINTHFMVSMYLGHSIEQYLEDSTLHDAVQLSERLTNEYEALRLDFEDSPTDMPTVWDFMRQQSLN